MVDGPDSSDELPPSSLPIFLPKRSVSESNIQPEIDCRSSPPSVQEHSSYSFTQQGSSQKSISPVRHYAPLSSRSSSHLPKTFTQPNSSQENISPSSSSLSSPLEHPSPQNNGHQNASVRRCLNSLSQRKIHNSVSPRRFSPRKISPRKMHKNPSNLITTLQNMNSALLQIKKDQGD